MSLTVNTRRVIAFFPAILLISVLLCLTTPAVAQYTTASLGGAVLDSTGAIVPDARVTVRNIDTGLRQTTSSDAAGAFLFPRLPIGNYELTVDKEGFSTYVQ